MRLPSIIVIAALVAAPAVAATAIATASATSVHPSASSFTLLAEAPA